MKFSDVKLGAIFIEKFKPSKKYQPLLFVHIIEDGPAENTSFRCATLDIYDNAWGDTYWKSRQWESSGGGDITQEEMHLIAKTIFTANNK